MAWEGRILGQRCPTCQKVYVPPRSACPVVGVPTTKEVQLPDKGTVTTYCIVNVPFLGQQIKPPYVSAYVLLDGADIGFLHLVLDAGASEVRIGMRVEAVWKPRDEWGTTIENISHSDPPVSRTPTTRPTSSTCEPAGRKRYDECVTWQSWASPKDRQNACKNPYAHLHNEGTTVDTVLASKMRWDPIRYDETCCPSSDGACAMVVGSEATSW